MHLWLNNFRHVIRIHKGFINSLDDAGISDNAELASKVVGELILDLIPAFRHHVTYTMKFKNLLDRMSTLCKGEEKQIAYRVFYEADANTKSKNDYHALWSVESLHKTITV